MKKVIYILAAIVMLSGCSDNSFMGITEVRMSENEKHSPEAINFGAGSSRSYTRADLTGNDAANALNQTFCIYGVKTVGGENESVCPNYVVEYDGTDGAGAAGSTSSNLCGWEYVGLTSHPMQTIHYWDYDATNYTFQAWSTSKGNASVKVEGSNTLTISATSANELSNLYVADLVSIDRDDTDSTSINSFGSIITFTFRNMAAKVRFGIYETIAGYSVSQLTFRSAKGYFDDNSTHMLLEGTFCGSNNSEGGSYKLNYNDNDNRAVLYYSTTSTTSTYYDFGSFTSEVIATTKSDPTWAGGTSAFLNVLPNEDKAGDMRLLIDFTLTADDGSEDAIRVKGANVTIPARKMVWHPNFAYTYLFKISKDVNGTTGEEGVDPEKLYPITFSTSVDEIHEVTTVPIETGQ